MQDIDKNQKVLDSGPTYYICFIDMLSTLIVDKIMNIFKIQINELD